MRFFVLLHSGDTPKPPTLPSNATSNGGDASRGKMTLNKGSQIVPITLLSVSLCLKIPDAGRVTPLEVALGGSAVLVPITSCRTSVHIKMPDYSTTYPPDNIMCTM